MNDQSKTWTQLNWLDTPNVISSPESEDGVTRSNSPDGLKKERSGQEAARVSRSQSQEKLTAWATSGIYGQLFIGLSPSAILQSCLENRLRERLAVNGSVDLEALGYAVGAADLCGHLSRQKRQRIYWVASNSVRERVPRLEHSEGIIETRPWGPRSEADLQSVIGSPFMDGSSWPQPLIRSGIDGVPERVGRLRGCGNSIVPGIAAEFIGAYMEIQV